MVLHNRHTRYMGAGGQEPVSKALLLKIEKYKKIFILKERYRIIWNQILYITLVLKYLYYNHFFRKSFVHMFSYITTNLLMYHGYLWSTFVRVHVYYGKTLKWISMVKVITSYSVSILPTGVFVNLISYKFMIT